MSYFLNPRVKPRAKSPKTSSYSTVAKKLKNLYQAHDKMSYNEQSSRRNTGSRAIQDKIQDQSDTKILFLRSGMTKNIEVPLQGSRSLLVAARRCSSLLVAARRCSSLLVAARRCSSLLVAARRCSNSVAVEWL
jgi:hypothetical protein